MHKKKTFQYGRYQGGIAVLWWVEVQIFRFILWIFVNFHLRIIRGILFIPVYCLNLVGKIIDKLIWAVSKLFDKEYEANIAEKIFGYPYRLWYRIKKWWDNLTTEKYEQAYEPELYDDREVYISDDRPYARGRAYVDNHTRQAEQEEEEIVEELPFCQIFRLNETEDLHIVRVEYCPDETAFIRVVSEESYTKEYKRKVQIDEAGNRFIEFNDKKYYLKCSGDDEVIDIDKMDGATFEHFCADLLRVNGWTDVQITPASGDHGIDITAEKDDIKWGFQCKRWNGTKVDAVAIGQTYKGKALYECDIVAIITTSSFTRQAEDEARQLGIKLWRRAKIRQLMSKLENAEDYYLSA